MRSVNGITFLVSQLENHDLLKSRVPFQNATTSFFGSIAISYSVSSDPLFSVTLRETTDGIVFVIGFWYSKEILDDVSEGLIDIKTENDFQKYSSILNGRYVCMYIAKDMRKVMTYTDDFGFDDLFLTVHEGMIHSSSHIWPLLFEYASIKKQNISQYLAFGYSLGFCTLFDNVYRVPPDSIVRFRSDGVLHEQGLKDSFMPHEAKYLNIGGAIEEYDSIASKFISFLHNAYSAEDIGITLTGGGDTRAILNTFLHNRIKPVSFTGNWPPQDVPRSEVISRSLGLEHHIVRYEEKIPELVDYDLFVYSNGTMLSLPMAKISTKARPRLAALVYGFSGDIMSGSYYGHQVNKMCKREIRKQAYFKSHYQGHIVPDIVKYGYSNQGDFWDDYLYTFSKYADYMGLYDATITQDIVEKNKKRIGPFALGSHFGPAPIFFFHNRDIVSFYKTLGNDLLKGEKFHKHISERGNAILHKTPDEGKTPGAKIVNDMLFSVLGKQNLVKLYRSFKYYKSWPRSIFASQTRKISVDKWIESSVLSNQVNLENDYLLKDMQILKQRLEEINGICMIAKSFGCDLMII